MTRRLAHFVSPLLLLVVSMSAGRAAGPEVRAEYRGGFDLTRLTGCNWSEGLPAENYRIEQRIRHSVERQLTEKGYEFVTSEADCLVRTRVVTQKGLPVGVLIVEVLDAESETVVWRGEASGLTDHRLKKLEKLVGKSVKKMFRDFPRSN